MTRHALFLPPFDALADPRLLADLAADAESAGWDGVFLWDHIHYRAPVRAVTDPWVCLAAMGAATDRLVLGPMVTPLARRRPQVLARQAVAVDLLTRGRLVLGLGLGDDWAGEYSSYGDEPDPRTRAAMLDEGLTLLGAALSGEELTHRGEHYTADGVRFLPRPYQDRHLPVWLAGRWPNRAPLRRAVRHDGAFVIGVDSPAAATELTGVLHELRGGLDGFEVVLELPVAADPATAAEWAAVPGVTWLLTNFAPYDLDAEAVRTLVRQGPPGT